MTTITPSNFAALPDSQRAATRMWIRQVTSTDPDEVRQLDIDDSTGNITVTYYGADGQEVTKELPPITTPLPFDSQNMGSADPAPDTFGIGTTNTSGTGFDERTSNEEVDPDAAE